MPKIRPTNPLGVALTAVELWRRLPPAQRKQVLQATRRHGPKLAAALLAKRKASLRKSARTPRPNS